MDNSLIPHLHATIQFPVCKRRMSNSCITVEERALVLLSSRPQNNMWIWLSAKTRSILAIGTWKCVSRLGPKWTKNLPNILRVKNTTHIVRPVIVIC
ncbi:MAG: hypothetical protein MHMPM18_004768 [Marteilia pararefringens]